MSLTDMVLYSKLKFVEFWLRNVHVIVFFFCDQCSEQICDLRTDDKLSEGVSQFKYLVIQFQYVTVCYCV